MPFFVFVVLSVKNRFTYPSSLHAPGISDSFRADTETLSDMRCVLRNNPDFGGIFARESRRSVAEYDTFQLFCVALALRVMFT